LEAGDPEFGVKKPRTPDAGILGPFMANLLKRKEIKEVIELKASCKNSCSPSWGLLDFFRNLLRKA
jgi:hypothetical protein